MIAREASQAINAIFYTYFEAKEKKNYFFAFCFFPQLIQLTVTFLLLYISIALMMSTNDSASLLQNFAALYVIIEMDNITMNFLRITKFNMLLLILDNYFHEISGEIEEKTIYSREIVTKVLFQEKIEIDYKQRPEKIKNLFIFTRIAIIFLLIGIGVLFWMAEVYASL